MQTTNEFIDAVKVRHGLETDYALAKLLGIRHSNVSNYRAGRSTMDNRTAVKVAELLAMKPMEVIAAVEMERARDEKTKGFWMRYAAALVMFVGISSPPAPAEASTADLTKPVGNTDYTNKRRRKKSTFEVALQLFKGPRLCLF